MYKVCCTRFTNQTWEQNNIWKERQNYSGCIYNSPIKIKETIPLQSVVFIIEMNNDLNTIMGIGMVKNYIHTDKYYKIYEDGNYNRYTYKSLYRIDKNEFKRKDKIYINILEQLIFKGSYHIKRSHGITQLPLWISENNHIDFIELFKTMFIKKYFNKKESSRTPICC
jgi:hypothetical protein